MIELALFISAYVSKIRWNNERQIFSNILVLSLSKWEDSYLGIYVLVILWNMQFSHISIYRFLQKMDTRSLYIVQFSLMTFGELGIK